MAKPINMTPEQEIEWRNYWNEWRREWRKKNIDKCKKWSNDWHKANPDKSRNAVKNWRKKNPERTNEFSRRWRKTNPEKAKAKDMLTRDLLSDHYVAKLMGMTVSVARKYPELIEAKRHQITTHRKLCTRIQPTYKKSATTSTKRHTPHGLTNLLSLELSSWSTPWVRQLTLLLSKSKRQS